MQGERPHFVFRLAKKEGQEIEAVFGSGVGQFGIHHSGTGRHDVGQARCLGRDTAGLHLARPANDHRHAMPALPVVPLHAAPGVGAVVIVFLAHVEHRSDLGAVVAADDHECIVVDAECLEFGHQFAHNVVELKDEIPVRAGVRLAFEVLPRK